MQRTWFSVGKEKNVNNEYTPIASLLKWNGSFKNEKQIRYITHHGIFLFFKSNENCLLFIILLTSLFQIPTYVFVYMFENRQKYKYWKHMLLTKCWTLVSKSDLTVLMQKRQDKGLENGSPVEKTAWYWEMKVLPSVKDRNTGPSV